ncbi:MAG: S41 family peptidase [Lachnospiraceae bacterium]|nr:S41 family peptidase [Lachnospiraceae bacterium]
MDNGQFEESKDLSRYEADEKPGNGKSLFIKGIIIGILLSAAFVLGFLVVRSHFVKKEIQSVLSDETEVRLATLRGLIDTYYYKDVDDAKLAEGVLKGMVDGLEDPYSEYYTKEEYEQVKINTTGNYDGIGAVLSQNRDSGLVSIVRIYEDSPAEKAGIKIGDEIISADGYQASGSELSDFVKHVRGRKGTKVLLVIQRGAERITMEVERDDVNIPSVAHHMLDDEIGYIIIGDFSSNTCNEFEEALEDLRSQGAKAIVYDVRSNPGGLVKSTTDILDILLPEGNLVYMMDKKGKKIDYNSQESSRVDMPAAVLINGDSASASEIFAGALRDYDYATLIGTRTYGKGVVQNTLPLIDGSALKLTTATYYTSKGECINEKGIEPDIELEYEYTGEGSGEDYEYDKDNQVQKALEVLKKELK